MIVSVTANTTIDQTVFVPELIPDTTIRASRTVQSMGGKPTDASWILGEIGIPSLALGFAGGATGDKVVSLLRARGVMTDFTPADGDTRINVIIVDERNHTHTTITTTTMQIAPPHLDALRTRYLAALDEASVVVLGGTLPKGLEPGFYTEFIGLARERGVPVVFDAAEPNLSAGLLACPTYIKPNQDEISQLSGQAVHTLDDAYRAGRAVLERTGTIPIITMGSEGGLAVLPDRAYFIPPLPVEVVSPGGAGDAVLAGITASIHRQQPIEEGLRLGFAAAAAVVMLPGTADCRRADVERFLPHVELRPYP
jgi:1-phosphofructokinase family hexose kinase